MIQSAKLTVVLSESRFPTWQRSESSQWYATYRALKGLERLQLAAKVEGQQHTCILQVQANIAMDEDKKEEQKKANVDRSKLEADIKAQKDLASKVRSLLLVSRLHTAWLHLDIFVSRSNAE